MDEKLREDLIEQAKFWIQFQMEYMGLTKKERVWVLHALLNG